MLCYQVHILTTRQTITLVCDVTPDVVGSRRDSLTSFLSDVTSADVTVDLIRHCYTSQYVITCISSVESIVEYSSTDEARGYCTSVWKCVIPVYHFDLMVTSRVVSLSVSLRRLYEDRVVNNEMCVCVCVCVCVQDVRVTTRNQRDNW